MTGSGTPENPFVIQDINDLQAMRDDLIACYELGGDIDASITEEWNGGAGFEPVGIYEDQEAFSIPDEDHSFGGSWTVYPADPPSKWDKVDDGPRVYDAGSTYIRTDTVESWVLFNSPAITLRPDAQNIKVSIEAALKIPADPWYAGGQCVGYIRIGGNNYMYGGSAIPKWLYGWVTLGFGEFNPATGEPWSVDSLLDIEAFGIYITQLDPGMEDVRITSINLIARYNLFFAGSFDGKEHTISNLHINRPDQSYIGLFGYAVPNALQNVKLENVNITGGAKTGALAGEIYSPYSAPENCSSSGSINGNGDGIGGLFGAASGYFKRCHSSCSIIAEGDCVGGLAGSLLGDAEECHAMGNVQVTGEHEFVGGLAGYCLAEYPFGLRRSYATGNVQAGSCSYVGGLIGATSFKSGPTEDCYARGSVSGYEYVGGLIGAYYSWTKAKNSYSTGLVTGEGDYVGGLIGVGGSEIAVGCFWDLETSGQSSSDGGTGKTTEEMKRIATFADAGWDIGTSRFNPTGGYPFLSWQVGSSPIWLIYHRMRHHHPTHPTEPNRGKELSGMGSL